MRFFVLTLTLLYLLVCNDFATAQEQVPGTSEVVVLLTTGGKVQGKIIEDKPGDKLVVQRSDGELFELPYDKIDSIKRPDNYKARQTEILASPKEVAAVEPNFCVRLILGTADAEDVIGPYGVTGVVGRMVTDRVYLGAGGGWLVFADSDDGFLPVFGEVQYHITVGTEGLYFYGRGGWALGFADQLSGSNWGGDHFGFGMGVYHTFPDRVAMSLALGYTLQSVKDGHPHFPDNANHLSLEIGLLF